MRLHQFTKDNYALPVCALIAVSSLGLSQKTRPEPTVAQTIEGMLVVRGTEGLHTLNAKIKQLARSGGGQVYLPAGSYEVDEPILLGDNITLRGDGPGTVLVASERFDKYLRDHKVYGGASDVSILFQPRGQHFGILNAKGVQGVRIYDLTLRGNRENVRVVTGILLHESQDVTVRGVAVQDCGGSGIAVLRSSEVVLTEIRSRRNHNGIIISGPADTTNGISVTNCYIADNRWSGVYLCGEGDGVAKTGNGPADVIIANNFVFRHLCDEGIKGFGVKDVVITGNRVDYALEGNISVNGSNVVIANNICSHGDDGMNNKGNGIGIAYGSRQDNRLNVVIQGNICREGNGGIWSESFREEGGKAQPQGRVAVVGNVCADNVTSGIGQVMKSDLTCIGNVCTDNGHSNPDPESPAQDNMGIIVGGGTVRSVTLGNVVSDTRPPEKKRLKYGLILRGCDDGLASHNYVTGCKLENVKEQNKGKNFLNERNGEAFTDDRR